jgi:hypothetical protein
VTCPLWTAHKSTTASFSNEVFKKTDFPGIDTSSICQQQRPNLQDVHGAVDTASAGRVQV